MGRLKIQTSLLDWMTVCDPAMRYLFRCSLLLLLFTSVAVSWLPFACAVPPDHNDEALRKMCEEGLAKIALDYCRAQVTLYSEQAPLRARWAMRELECAGQVALRVQDDALWKAIGQREAEYRKEFPEDPRLPWFGWQVARCELLHAQQALAQLLATPSAEQHRATALKSVRLILDYVAEVEKDIAQRLPLTEPGRSTAKQQAPSTELLELSTDCTLLKCEALLVRSKSYPMGSPDRRAAAADVVRTADAMLKRAPQDWAARDELLVARATAGMETGSRAESLQILLKILNGQAAELGTDAAKPGMQFSAKARVRAGATAIDILCQDKKLSAAQEALQIVQQNFSGPEVALSQLRVRLASSEALPNEKRSAELAAVIEQAKDVGTRFGPYWRNRAEALLLTNATSTSNDNASSTSTELVTVEVRQLLRAGQTAAAIAKLKTASENAQSNEDAEHAIEFAMQAAALMQRDKLWIDAADWLSRQAAANQKGKRAPAAQALAAWSIAQAIQQAPGDSLKPKLNEEELASRYQNALRDQLRLWPDAPECDKAEEYLSLWLSKQNQISELATFWLDRARESQQKETQVRAMHRWLSVVIGRLPTSEIMAQRQALQKAIEDKQLASIQRTATILSFAAAMLHEPLTQVEAEAVLKMSWPTVNDEVTAADQNLWSAIQILAAARRNDPAAAKLARAKLDFENMPAEIRLAWTKNLTAAMDELIGSQTTPWLETLSAVPWTTDDERTSSLKMTGLKLQLLVKKDSDQADDLIKKIKELALANAKDAKMQLAYAAAIVHRYADAEHFKEAITALNRVIYGSSKDSDAFLVARWMEIHWRAAKGESKAVKELAASTLRAKNISPAWWRSRFESLAQ